MFLISGSYLVWSLIYLRPFSDVIEIFVSCLADCCLFVSLPVARSAHGATVYNDKLWIFAGYDGNARYVGVFRLIIYYPRVTVLFSKLTNLLFSAG